MGVGTKCKACFLTLPRNLEAGGLGWIRIGSNWSDSQGLRSIISITNIIFISHGVWSVPVQISKPSIIPRLPLRLARPLGFTRVEKKRQSKGGDEKLSCWHFQIGERGEAGQSHIIYVASQKRGPPLQNQSHIVHILCLHSNIMPLFFFHLRLFLAALSRGLRRYFASRKTVHSPHKVLLQVNPCFNQVNDPFSPCRSGHARNVWKDFNIFHTHFHLIYRGNLIQ